MELNKDYAKFGRQVGYVVGSNIILSVLGLIQISVLTKELGASLYGTWSLVNVTVSFIVPFALLGFTVSFVRLLAAEKDRGRIGGDFSAAFFVVLGSGIIFSILLFFFSDPLAASIFNVNLSQYIKLGSILILLNCLGQIGLSFFRTFRQIGRLTIITLTKSILELGLIVLAVLLGYKLIGVIIAIIINNILFIFVTLFIVLKQIGFQAPRFSHLRPHLRFGLPAVPRSAMMWIITFSDRYIISYFMGVSPTGIYNAAYVLATHVSFFIGPTGTLLFPTVSKSYDEKNLEETRNYLKYSLKYFMMVAIPSAFGLSILAKPILQILTTPEFLSGYTIVPLIAFGTLLYGVYVIGTHPIVLVYKTELITALLGTAAALNIGLNILLIPRMGILGAAVATLIAYSVLGILTLMVSRRYLKFDLSLPFMAKSVIASVIMTLCIWLIHPESIAMVIGTIFAGAAIYFAVLLLVKGLSKEEITFFVTFAKDNIKRIPGVK